MEPITYKLQHEGNRYWTDPILSDSEWLDVLHLVDSNKNEMQLNALLMFFYQPGHKSTCSAVGKAYSLKADSVRNLIMNFGKFVIKNSGFRIETTESEKDTYWCVPMLGKELKDHFEWELRPELVAALRTFLIEKLIAEYRGPVLKEGLDNSRSKESYKWRLLSSAKGKSITEVLDVLSCPEMNILTWRTKGSIKAVQKTSPEQLENCFSKLLAVEGDFYEKFDAFVSVGKGFLSKQDAERILKEKEAALFLACINPAGNAVYKWTLYKTAASYLGLDVDSKRPYDAFVKILKSIIPIENEDSELVEKMKAETEGYFWSDLLNAQDVLWQTQEFMKASGPKNWLQIVYDQAISAKEGVYADWYPAYEESVKRFQGMFDEGMTAEDVSEDTKDFFLRVVDNYISANPQGMYSYDEYERILTVWPDIYDTLKRNFAAGAIDKDEFDQLYQRLVPLTSKNKFAAYHRIWAGLFPDHLTSIISDDRFYYLYKCISAQDTALPKKKGHWLDDNLALMAYFQDKVTFKKPWHRAVFGWYLYEYFKANNNDNDNDMSKYIELLKANKNLVLTGAPGTGKTHLAKMMAKAMGDDNPGFVQFHPSYDYTDFVEGLRPNDEGTFERVNGVFKQFCADALNSHGTVNFDEAYSKLIGDLSSYTSPMIIKSGIVSSSSFGILVNSKGSLDLYNFPTQSDTISPVSDCEVAPPEMKKNGSLTKERIRDWENQIYWKGYYKGVYQLLKDKYGLVEGKSTGPVPRVFIIDEINRGELSKIFGELFFAIEPGYRGTKGRVKTQYQNLVEPGDPFEKGFYVPENVYVIGTMNDIDRGVESMDFAIRRRFGWMEIKVEDRIGMLDEEIPEWSEAAKRCIEAVNKVLKEKEIGLTRAYDIGPSYFLKLKNYDGRFEDLWEYHIQGILAEYLRGMRNVDEKLKTLKEAFDSYKG